MNRFKDISGRFPAEAAAIGRLLTGYADLEISLMHCVQMARGGDLDTVLKAMFNTRGETRRINTASALGQLKYNNVGLGLEFTTAINDMRFCLDIRNRYAHSLWHNDNSGCLSFVNLEELARTPTVITDLLGLTIRYIDMPILDAQEKYLNFVDHSIQYINFEGRFRRGDLTSNPIPAPTTVPRPPLSR